MSRLIINRPDGSRTVTTESGMTVYRKDGAPILVQDIDGLRVAAEKKRIYAMDNVIRYYHYSKEQIKKTMAKHRWAAIEKSITASLEGRK